MRACLFCYRTRYMGGAVSLSLAPMTHSRIVAFMFPFRIFNGDWSALTRFGLYKKERTQGVIA